MTCLSLLTACQAIGPKPASVSVGKWAIAIHGGAGTMDPNTPADRLAPYESALRHALEHGRDLLAAGTPALDVCQSVVELLEDDPLFNAGKGAVYNEKGEHELDAAIMDGSNLRCGAVAGVRTVRHPIALARAVMTKTRHVLLAGVGAETFADTLDLERVENTWFDTDSRRRALDRALENRKQAGALKPPADRRLDYGTVGCVALDQSGKLAAATSTGGMTGKKWGRVGDAPLIGAGTYADAFAAISCTGTGEEFIRHGIARAVSARMQFAGQSLRAATDAVVHEVLAVEDGGLIAVDSAGNLAAPFNTSGMYRGMAASDGTFQVAIFRATR